MPNQLNDSINEIQKVLIIINIAIIAYATTVIRNELNKKLFKSRRSIWTRQILRRRREEGTHNVLIPQLLSDGFHYKNFLRMDKDSFKFLLNLVEPLLLRADTKWRRSITVSERLAVTLRYLATGRLITICLLYNTIDKLSIV